MNVTLAQIAAALGIDKRSVLVRAKREKWPSSTGPVRGGQAFILDTADLPASVRQRIHAKLAIKAVKAASQQGARPMPEVFVLVVDGEVFEVRRLGQ